MFFQKASALNYYNSNNNKNKHLFLFAEDKTIDGHKVFHVCEQKCLFDFIKQKRNNFYELWVDEQEINFSIDYDYKIKEKDVLNIDDKNNVFV